jgi:hypothetical protein
MGSFFKNIVLLPMVAAIIFGMVLMYWDASDGSLKASSYYLIMAVIFYAIFAFIKFLIMRRKK